MARAWMEYRSLGTVQVGDMGTLHVGMGHAEHGPGLHLDGGKNREGVLTINGVTYRVSAIIDFPPGSGPCVQHLYTSRPGSFGPSDATPSALRKLRPALVEAVTVWLAANPRALWETRLVCANNDACRAAIDVDTARAKLEAAEQVLAGLEADAAEAERALAQ